ncbi:MAG: STAS domain-containing protein [Deltaproteobacteria bacterium]|nr:STAS domain-containing protein [Deltaproteobacteria bacterium]
MEQGSPALQWSEHADTVLLELQGTIDVFVAADLYATAKQLVALGKDVTISCTRTEGLDASAVQILLVLQTELHIQGKRLTVTDVPPPIKKWIAHGGLANMVLSEGEAGAS